MKIVHIADSSPAPKINKKEDLKQAAALIGSRRNIGARRKAAKILEIMLNGNM
jgi:hypothetical protein